MTTTATGTAVGAAPTRRSARTSAWRTDVQGLRAVAVGLVVLAHVGLPWMTGGFIGVDVFFVISGYLITGLLLREHERRSTIGIADFYARRARRILPAATVVTIVTLAAAALVLPLTRIAQTAQDARWAAVFLANGHFAASGTDYFASEAPSLLQHYWSLAVEEQFYLVWPVLVLVVLHRWGRRVLALVTTGVLVLSLIWSMVDTALWPTAAYFNTPARAYELTAGALLACVLSGTLRAPLRALTGIAGAALLAWAAIAFGDGSAFPGWRGLLPTTAAVLLLASGQRTLVGNLLSTRPLRWLGDVSFSLYLWHWPIILIVPQLLPTATPAFLSGAIALVLSLALSALTHRFVEVPFQRGRVPLLTRGRRALLLWPISVALVVACSFASLGAGGIRQTVSEQRAQAWFGEQTDRAAASDPVPDVATELHRAVDLADEGAPIPASIDGTRLTQDGWRDLSEGCAADDGETASADCRFGDADADEVVALVGDSHAAMWLPAFDEMGRSHGFQVRLFAKMSCAYYPVEQPAPAMSQAECDAYRSWTDDQLAQLRPDRIVVSARGELYMQPLDGVSIDDQWHDAVRQSVSRLTEDSPDVTVLGDVPSREDAGECLTSVGATQESCVSTPDGTEASSNAVTERAVEAADVADGSTVRFLDVTPYLCADDRCPLVVGDVATYEDDSHLNRAWAEHLAPRLAADLGW